MNLRIPLLFWITVSFCLLETTSAQSGAKHLFILSGQSNMQGLRLEESFIPTIETAFGAENILIVKDALGGQPIRRWYKKWKPASGDLPKAQPDLYDSLMNKVFAAIEGQEIQVKVGDSKQHFAWIDTDDLNDGLNRKGKAISNDLHMSAEGYIEMGKRFAEAAIRLIERK